VASWWLIKRTGNYFCIHIALHIRHFFRTLIDQKNDQLDLGVIGSDRIGKVLKKDLRAPYWADAGRTLDVFFTPDELALMPDDVGLVRTLLWAAKEAAYKAARLDVAFRPRQVAIEGLSAAGFTWRVRDRAPAVVGAGRFAMVGRHVVAIAATSAAGDGGACAWATAAEAAACS
jgi:hypothetical protein